MDRNAREWEEQFRQWAKPPGSSEEERCENAIKAVRNAIANSAKLKSRDVSVFSQGSYRNNTNVRKDSDVDLGVLCRGIFYSDLPEGKTKADFNIIGSDYEYATFKAEVGQALTDYFGQAAVKRGNKAFDLHETSYHVDADVAPFFEHRRYQDNGGHLSGVELVTDKERTHIINWPEQHYSNGVQKNYETSTRFKAVVRILKALSNEMSDARILEADVPGFLIECLAWNAPNSSFGADLYTLDVSRVIMFLANKTSTEEGCKEWGEVSELKYLFRPQQKWTRQQANDFIKAAWAYVGF